MYNCYTNEILASLLVLDGTKETLVAPAWSYLFRLDKTNTGKLVDKTMPNLFQHHIAKLLFLSKHTTRPNLQTTVVFLYTRVLIARS